eukprot:gene32744-43759_t
MDGVVGVAPRAFPRARRARGGRFGGGKPVRLKLPTRSQTHGYLHGRLIVSLQEDWTFRDTAYASGSLLAVDVPAMLAVQDLGLPASTSAAIRPVADVLFKPQDREALDPEQIRVTENRVVAVRYNNVRGSLVSFRREDGADWQPDYYTALPNAAVSLVATADSGDAVFYTEENFLTPTRLMLAPARWGKSMAIKTLPARFDASTHVVEQKEATSKDGTKIPYFIVHPKGH